MKKTFLFVLMVWFLTACGNYGGLLPDRLEILEVTASKAPAALGEEILLSVEVSNPGEEALSYLWLAAEGAFDTYRDKTVRWRAPDQESLVIVTVYVSGSSGREVSREITLDVRIAPEDPELPPLGYYGTGKDGHLLVTGNEIVNKTVSKVSGSLPAGSRQITPASTNGFFSGDEIFLYNGQGSEAGTYYFLMIAEVSGGILLLETPLRHGYPGEDQVFVYRVPHYKQVIVESGGNLTCEPWSAASGGGIVLFRSQDFVSVQGTGAIDVTGMGYAGAKRGLDDVAGYQGEGTVGVGSQNAAANGNGGGGGTGGFQAGGGGGHAFPGGNGTEVTSGSLVGVGTGGLAVGNPRLTKIYFGGAGGSGHDNDTNVVITRNGGSGGGIIWIASPFIYTGNILADASAPTASVSQDGGAGGGAGGSIFLKAETLTISGTISVRGTAGFQPPNHLGNPNSSGHGAGTGGYGSVGRIRFDFDTKYLYGTVDPAPYEG